MSLFREAIHRDTILFINGIRPETIEATETYKSRYDKHVKILIMVDQSKKKLLETAKQYAKKGKVEVISCNINSPAKIKTALAPYMGYLLAVTSQFESAIPMLKRVLPHVPYLNGPTQESLDWATDKIKMRNMFKAHSAHLSPPFTVIDNNLAESLDKVEKNVGYPVVVKPAGLAASLLVSVCYHREELEAVLASTFKKIEKVYKEQQGRGKPQVLVEKLMEGTMYVVDAYVNNRGNVYLTPPVHVKTGRAIGFDDFFGYQRMTPTKLTSHSIDGANHTCIEAVRALGMRSTTCHIELIKTANQGWKIIELAPRMGGYRHMMYDWSFGINHILNDILIRIPQKPVIPKKRKGFTAVFSIYGKTEGRLEAIRGLAKLRKLKSFQMVNVHKKKGDALTFAKNGGKNVLEVFLFNEDRSELLADIRRMETAVEIVVGKKRGNLTGTSSIVK